MQMLLISRKARHNFLDALLAMEVLAASAAAPPQPAISPCPNCRQVAGGGSEGESGDNDGEEDLGGTTGSGGMPALAAARERGERGPSANGERRRVSGGRSVREEVTQSP